MIKRINCPYKNLKYLVNSSLKLLGVVASDSYVILLLELNMEICYRLIAGGLYLFHKRCIQKNNYKHFKNADKIFRDNIQKQLLPIGRVISFVITKWSIEVLIRLHPEHIIKNVPRLVCDQIITLTSEKLDQYLSGEIELHNITEPAKLCVGQNVHTTVIKKVGNFLQSFTLQYNRALKRSCRLTKRKHEWYSVKEDEIQDIIAMHMYMPYINGESQDPRKGKSSVYHDVKKQSNECIAYKEIMSYFGSSESGFYKYTDDFWDFIKNKNWGFIYCTLSSVKLIGEIRQSSG